MKFTLILSGLMIVLQISSEVFAQPPFPNGIPAQGQTQTPYRPTQTQQVQQANAQFPATTQPPTVQTNPSVRPGSAPVAVASKSITRPTSEQKSSTPSPAKKTVRKSSLWSTLGALSLVILLILVLGFFWKRQGVARTGGLPREVLDVLGKRPLDQRQSLHLLRFGNRILVVGSTGTDLRTLAEIDDPQEVQEMLTLCEQPVRQQGLTQSFWSLFQRQQESENEAAPGSAEAELYRRLHKKPNTQENAPHG